MNEEERYIFDLQGYIKIEGAIAPEIVASMNAWLDAKAETDPAWQGEAKHTQWQDPIFWTPDFRNLIDNPRVLPCLKELLGPFLRLDHCYAVLLKPGGNGLRLHGGGTPHDPTQFYHVAQGRMFNGLTTAAFALTDAAEGDGGFACIPGSHKSHFECPEDIRTYERTSPLVRQVPTKAGDCIVFTEALLHGTMPWRGKHIRRTVFMKYSPGYMSWGYPYYFPGGGTAEAQAIEAEFTERQRILLDPPCEYKHRKVP